MKEISFLSPSENKQKTPNPKTDFVIEGTDAIFRIFSHLYEKEDQVL